MGISSIKYKRKTIKLIWEKYEDCFGIFDPSKLTLHINPKLSKKMLGKILFHEIWHVICYLNETNINLIGEEKTALLRNAKLRLSNMHPGRLLMNMRGQDKWIK